MATFTHTTGVSVSADGEEATWSQGNYSQSLGEVAASWYALESVHLGYIFWEGFDDINWEDMTICPVPGKLGRYGIIII